MKITSHNAADAPQPTVGHAQVVEVSGATRFAYFSGQVSVTRDGAAIQLNAVLGKRGSS